MSDYRTTTGEAPPLTMKARRKRWRLLGGAVAAAVVAAAAAGSLIQVDRWARAGGYVATEHYAEVRAAAPGRVAEWLVSSGDRVREGDVMVRLDDREEQAALEEAKSRVRQVEAELGQRRAEVEDLKRQRSLAVDLAALRLRHASARVARSEELVARGLASASALEDEKLKESLARAELAALEARDGKALDMQVAVLEQEHAARRDAVARAEARAEARVIRAPIAGQVLRYEFYAGELVQPDRLLYDVFGGERRLLKLRVPERFATRIGPGQPCRATLAAYRGLRGERFEGRVESLRDAIQADGKETYRAAYCSFDPGALEVPPGMTADAEICYGRSCLLFFLLGLD